MWEFRYYVFCFTGLMNRESFSRERFLQQKGEEMTTMVWVYLGYLAICIVVTLLVARTLRKYGPVFIAGNEAETSPLVRAKTHLMIVGFYLITLGLIGFALRYGGEATDAKTAIEILSTKIGGMIFVIGFMHFSMVATFVAARNQHLAESNVPMAKPVKSFNE